MRRPARHHRQPGPRRGDAPRGGPGARRRRPLPRRRGRQGDGRLLRHGQPGRERLRLLARRRVRVRRQLGLRPQGARHHRPGRLGVGQAAFPRAGRRRAARPVHLRRHRRHVGRRVRQRHALQPDHRLLAAFDHRNVFVDPEPDAAISFAERRRLYRCPVPRGTTTTARCCRPAATSSIAGQRPSCPRRKRASRSRSPTTWPRR